MRTKTLNPRRVRLPRKTRERLIRNFIEKRLLKDGSFPSQRETSEAVGGDIRIILAVLRDYRQRTIRYWVRTPLQWGGRFYQRGDMIAAVDADHVRRLDIMTSIPGSVSRIVESRHGGSRRK